MKKRLFSLLLAVLMLCSLAPGALATDLTPVSSQNNNAQSYHQGGWTYYAPGGYYTLLRHANPVNSYLFAESGGFCRVEYVWGDAPQLVVETYSADRSILSQKTLEIELPLFGGFFAGTDANYVIFGKEQPTITGDDSEEIIRVVKYSKDFKRLGSVSIKGNNTIIPFDAGSLRMVEDDTYLYVHTAHEMYQTDDGLNHQANLTFVVRKSDLTVTDIRSSIMNSAYGYVSHSFNQFVVLDDGDLVTLDHGDAGSTRSAYLYRCDAADSDGKCLPSFYNGKRGEGIDLMQFPSTDEHYNATGANLGGLIATTTHYLVAGSSVDPNEENLSLDHSQRNIFVCAVPKTAFSENSVQTYWLTSYPSVVSSEDAARVSTPHLVLLPDGRAMVLWTLDNTLFYQYLGANGQPTGEVHSREGALSDCAPTVIRGLVQWYVTDGGAPTFYAIDPSEQGHTKHEYALSGACDPSCDREGYTGDVVCVICGELFEKGSAIPALGHKWNDGEEDEPATCTDYGWKLYTCTVCGSQEYRSVSPLGHSWSAWTTVTEATEDSYGEETRTCERCGESETRSTPPLGHVHELVLVEGQTASCYGPGIEDYWECTGCGRLFADADGLQEIDEPVTHPVLDHSFRDTVTSPTCTAQGYTEHVCTVCGTTMTDSYTEPLGHSWGAWRVTKAATTEAEGEEARSCTRCGETQTRTIAKLTPGQPPVTPEEPCSGGKDCPSAIFTDVDRSADCWYHLAVDWAVTNKVTTGLTATTFGPGASCTRGQMVTFLWRAKGSPAPKQTANPFTDVKPGDYYYSAVLWAAENGITTGTDAKHFSPNATVTRAQTVTFLWRLEGRPEAKTAGGFSDVPSREYFAAAVDWAVEQGITNGVGGGKFAPGNNCTRAQIVTFLHRDLT